VKTLDKTEYNIKLDQIQNLVETQDIQGAAEVADTIDWRRVKSIRTLSMVADIYEANKRLEESKEILLLAYNRLSVGKAILYRLVEICVKLDHLEEAVDYYTEYSKVARGDHSKYILKYKIYRARRAPLEDQIAILEEYKQKEYTERWSFELARLYDRAGKQDKCIEECDDLILWFSEGKYVVKALELKMKYTPLSPLQQKKYDNRHEILDEPSFVSIKKPEASVTAPEKVAAPEKVTAPEKVAAHMGQGVNSEDAKPQMSGLNAAALEAAITSDKVLKDIENRTMSNEIAPAVPSRSNSENLQEKLATGFKDVLSGINKVKDEVAFTFGKKEDAAEDPEDQMEDIEEYENVKDLEPEDLGAADTAKDNTIDVVISTPVSKGSLPKEEVEEEVYAEEDLQEEEVITDDTDISKILEETAQRIADQIDVNQYMNEELSQAEEPSAEEKEEVVQSDIMEEEKGPAEISLEDQLKQILEESEKAEPEDVVLDEYVDTDAQVKTEAESDRQIKDGEDDAESDRQIKDGEDDAESDRQIKDGEDAADRAGDTVEMKKVTVPQEVPFVEVPQEELSIEEQILREETEEERRIRVLHDMRPDKLSDEHKKVFSYFAKIPGMDQQLLDALYGVYRFAGDKTSKRGNVAIMGQRGTGKTRLAENIVMAICKDLGLSAVKVACTDGEKLNQKDPAKVVAKLSGGFLLIEKAGAMSPETVAKLSRSLEFRTDSMVVIIEDEKSSMRKFLKEQEEFAGKFEAVISIPVFTNDELVGFARKYAKEMGYCIDEMGVLALYTLIGQQQTEAEPIAVAGVKDMVDLAIRNTQKPGRKFGRKLAVRGTNEDGHVILYEKDFEV